MVFLGPGGPKFIFAIVVTGGPGRPFDTPFDTIAHSMGILGVERPGGLRVERLGSLRVERADSSQHGDSPCRTARNPNMSALTLIA